MKKANKLKALKLFTIGIVLLISSAGKAQVSVSVNIGSPPAWGPEGYAEERFYYLPDVEAYYDVRNSMFIYMDGGVWVHRPQLMPQYRNYDLYGGYKVVMTGYRGERPYDNFREYHAKYARGYRGAPQKTIHERPEKGRSHEGGPSREHAKANEPRGHSNEGEHGKGHSNGNGQAKGHAGENGPSRSHSNANTSSEGHGNGPAKSHSGNNTNHGKGSNGGHSQQKSEPHGDGGGHGGEKGKGK